jgi:hypothetical protein
MEKQKLTNKAIEKYLKARQSKHTTSIFFGNIVGKVIALSLMTAMAAGSMWLAGIAIIALTSLFR